MAVDALRIGRLEYIDCQIRHTMVQYGDSTVCDSRIGDRRLRYPGKCEGRALTRGGAAARDEDDNARAAAVHVPVGSPGRLVQVDGIITRVESANSFSACS